MHLIFLPYSDDIRKIKPFLQEEEDSEERVQVEADLDLVDSMLAIIGRSVELECNGEPEPEKLELYSDPRKTRFYAVLEALALSEPIPEREGDPTLPDANVWQTLKEENFLDKFFLKLPEAEPTPEKKKRRRPKDRTPKSGNKKKAKFSPEKK